MRHGRLPGGASHRGAANPERMGLFDEQAGATLAQVSATFSQRGGEYGDTWRDCQWLTMKAVAREFQCVLPPHVLRALAAAALVDVKYQRMQGGWKADNLIDGIAYGACLVAEVERLKRDETEADAHVEGFVGRHG